MYLDQMEQHDSMRHAHAAAEAALLSALNTETADIKAHTESYRHGGSSCKSARRAFAALRQRHAVIIAPLAAAEADARQRLFDTG